MSNEQKSNFLNFLKNWGVLTLLTTVGMFFDWFDLKTRHNMGSGRKGNWKSGPIRTLFGPKNVCVRNFIEISRNMPQVGCKKKKEKDGQTDRDTFRFRKDSTIGSESIGMTKVGKILLILACVRASLIYSSTASAVGCKKSKNIGIQKICHMISDI